MSNNMHMGPVKGVIYYLEPEQNSFYVSGAEIENINIRTVFDATPTISITAKSSSWLRCTSKHYLIYSGFVNGVYTSFPIIHDGFKVARERVLDEDSLTRTFRIIKDAYPDYTLKTMTEVTEELFRDETAYIDRTKPAIVFGDICYPIVFKDEEKKEDKKEDKKEMNEPKNIFDDIRDNVMLINELLKNNPKVDYKEFDESDPEDDFIFDKSHKSHKSHKSVFYGDNPKSFGYSNYMLIKKEVVNEAVKPEYTVCANLCDGDDYIKHWHGGTFTDVEAAYKFYNIWEPNKKEVKQAIWDDLKDSHFDEYDVDNLNQYDLQIGCWDEDGNVVEYEGVEMFSSTMIDIIS